MPLGFLDVLNPLDTVVSHFFSFSSGIVNNILTHMCGRLYFPMFLFRVGLLTLINMASWMVLATLFSSLPRILKLSIDVLWPLMFWWWNIGESVFKCSLNLSPKVLPRLPYIFFIAFNLSTTITVDDTTLVGHFIFVLR